MKSIKCFLISSLLIFTGCTHSNAIENTESDNHLGENNNVSLINPMEVNSKIKEEPISNSMELLIASDDIYLDDKVIPYVIANDTGTEILVVLVPTLEKQIVDEWIVIQPEDVGFCGTPDLIDIQLYGEIPLSFYTNSLTEGNYRLSFSVVDNNYSTIDVLSVEFEIKNSGDREVSMQLIDNSNKNISIRIINKTNFSLTYGEHFIIERKNGDIWEAVEPIISNYAFNDIGYTINPRDAVEININWDWLYGELADGQYQLIKEVIHVNHEGTNKIYQATVLFEI